MCVYVATMTISRGKFLYISQMLLEKYYRTLFMQTFSVL